MKEEKTPAARPDWRAYGCILLGAALWGLIGLFNRRLSAGGLSAQSIVVIRNLGGLAVLTLVLRLVVKMLDLMARLPGIHMLNSLGGAAVGLAESVLILFLLFWVLDRFGVRIAQSTIDETYLLRFFVTEGPLGFLSVL